MNTKLILAICCAVGIGAVPLAGAHLTNAGGSWTSGALTGDNCRYNTNAEFDHPVFGGALNDIYSKPKKEECTTNKGVSGTYFGPSGVAIAGDPFQLSLYPVVQVFPNGYGTVANALCDMEVLGTGGGVGDIVFSDPQADPTDDLLNEPIVDDDPNGGTSDWSTTVFTDGSIDDGGYGAACHTSGYAKDDYNTLGCPGTSHAEDALTEEKVWINTGCDDETSVANPCVNVVFTGGATLQDCLDSITCVVGIPTACPDPAFEACGSDSSTDRVELGKGGGDRKTGQKDGNGQPWEGQAGPLQNLAGSNKKEAIPGIGVNYPRVNVDHPACTDSGTAVTYVLIGVEANAGDVVHKVVDGLAPIAESKTDQGENTFPNVEYSLAIGGWIDWTGVVDSNGNPTGPPINGTVFNVNQGGITVSLCSVPNVAGAVGTINTLLDGTDADGDVIDCPTGDFSTIDICNIDILVVDLEAIEQVCPG